MTTITLTKIDEVYMQVDSDDLGILQEMNDFFSFFMDGYRFSPKYKARMWDGKIRLFKYSQRKLYIGLISYVRRFAKSQQAELKIDPALIDRVPTDPRKTKEFIDGLNISILGKAIKPHTHQYVGIHHIIENKRACLLSPTSSGKSFIIYVGTRYILEQQDKKVLIVVPTVALVTQMYKDFIDYSSESDWTVDDEVHQISAGAEKHTDKSVVISTWQSLFKMPASYFDQFGGLMYDEAHLLKGQSLQTISDNCRFAGYRLGFTGTLDGAKANQLVIEGVTGKVKDLITTKKLMDDGKIAKLKIRVELIKYPEYMCKGARKLDYQEEIKAICGFTQRTNVVVDMAIKQTKNTLLLFNTIKHGKELYKRISEQCPDRDVYLIYGSTPKDVREQIRVAMESHTNAILVASYGTLSTGISIRNLHVIIFASPSKSKIRVLQSIGRGLRLHEDKTHMTLLDVVDDLTYKKHRNYSIKHFVARQEHYNKAGFDYEVYRTALAA